MADNQEEYEAEMEGEEAIETDVAAPESTIEPVAAPVAAPHTSGSHQHKQHDGQPSKLDRLKTFYRECVRVFKITKKPDREEFTTIVKISGLGILIIGAIGFLIHLVDQLLLH